MVDGPPHVMGFAVDLHEDLVQMPLVVGVAAHPLDSGFADFRGEKRAKPHPPKSDGLMADIDAALVQEVFDIA